MEASALDCVLHKLKWAKMPLDDAFQGSVGLLLFCALDGKSCSGQRPFRLCAEGSRYLPAVLAFRLSGGYGGESISVEIPRSSLDQLKLGSRVRAAKLRRRGACKAFSKSEGAEAPNGAEPVGTTVRGTVRVRHRVNGTKGKALWGIKSFHGQNQKPQASQAASEGRRGL